MSATLMPPRPRHWTLALGGALLLHAALALVFHQLVQGGTVAPGRGGIEVGLPPAGAAAGAPAEAAAVTPAAAPQAPEVSPEMAREVRAPAEVVEAQAAPPATAVPPAAEALYAPVESAEAVDPPQEPVTAEPAPPDEADATEVAAVEPVEEPAQEAVAEPVMAVPPPPKAKPRPPVVADAPAPPVVPTEAAEKTAEVATAATGVQDGPPAADEVIGNDGKTGTGDRAATGAAEGHSGGGAAGDFVDYKAQLLAWLEKHKEYPRRARLRRQEGTAVLHFVMDRSGRVVEYSIRESSGYKLLDEEVVAMIQRASPLPAPPEALAGDRLNYTVPVEFAQR